MEKITEIVLNNKIFLSVIIIILAIIIYTLITRTIDKLLERDKNKNQRLDKKGRTIFRLFNNITKYIIIIIAGILILQIYGVNVNSLVAGLGLVSVVVGLAIQDPLKDMISGMNIISDEYFVLGDVVKIDDIEGKVIEIGIRTSKIKDIKNGNVLVIANRNISKTIKLSQELYLDIPLSYEDEISKVEEILRKSAELIKKVEHVSSASYIGVNEFADSCMKYKMRIICNQEFKHGIIRAANRIIKTELDKNGISIPYPQLTIHNG